MNHPLGPSWGSVPPLVRLEIPGGQGLCSGSDFGGSGGPFRGAALGRANQVIVSYCLSLPSPTPPISNEGCLSLSLSLSVFLPHGVGPPQSIPIHPKDGSGAIILAPVLFRDPRPPKSADVSTSPAGVGARGAPTEAQGEPREVCIFLVWCLVFCFPIFPPPPLFFYVFVSSIVCFFSFISLVSSLFCMLVFAFFPFWFLSVFFSSGEGSLTSKPPSPTNISPSQTKKKIKPSQPANC